MFPNMNQGRLNLVSSPFLLGHSWLDLATQSHIRWVCQVTVNANGPGVRPTGSSA